MAWMETEYLKHMHFQWKINWWLKHFIALVIMGEMAHLKRLDFVIFHSIIMQNCACRNLTSGNVHFGK